ncbi:biotin--[acetyl-CoA-carboxylase] ligase [Lacticaseibacillus baoqingensis]|uniref:biotin--[biotin carboxyl-carrier protein] ligase n=1 Tax=Lacticaseibacillus baoqingensis TaxID=2486013 RepID=A0ABW4E6S0_9LACO|nr:biotin--[acetyl-CoA-carboxylase] ligase [Lacticaseibacillus baoqingensis]
MFTPDTLRALLPAALQTLPIETFTTTTSTNAVAATRVTGGQKAPFWLLANAQTNGVGRLGKAFFSPAQTGLYMTYALPAVAAPLLSLLTPAAGVALQQAIAQQLQVTTQIKWVNDLLIANQKVAGILASRLADGTILIGIGINIAPAGYRPDVAIDLPVGTLLSAQPRSDIRPALAAAWLSRFTALLAAPETIMPQYRPVAAWIGQTVRLSGAHEPVDGVLQGFADDGSLILRTASGLHQYNTGSIRLH